VSPVASSLPPLLGRDAELELLRSLIDQVEIENGGRTLVLRGEPGIGKSRLLAEAATLARERGWRILSATGVQSEAHLAFAGLHQLVRPVRSRIAGLPATQREVLDAAFGLSQQSAPERFRIALAALDLLCEVAIEAPLLLLADDAHWFDGPTAETLAFVARRVESDPILVLAAGRDGYSSPLVDAGLPEFRLGGLEAAEAAHLLTLSARQLSPATRDRILREATGNPLGRSAVLSVRPKRR
jgi:predicted ATPase